MRVRGFISRSFQPLVVAVSRTGWVRGYAPSKPEAVGIIVAHYFEWDGLQILSAFEHALTDANFHREAAKVGDMIADVACERV